MPEDLFDIDNLLNSAFKEEGLKDLFEKKIQELKLNKTNVQDILDLPYRTLKGILDGTQKLVDVTNLIKLSDFLQIPKEQVFKLYLESVQKKHPSPIVSPQKIKFIKENFELSVFKKAGLINSLTDFDHIEKKIIGRLGYKSIYEYKKPNIDVAFSSGLFKPKNILTRLFWIKCSMRALEELNNPYDYEKQSLIKLFPYILWHTLNEELGFQEVVKLLFKVGVTVIYQPNLQGLQLRGATFNVNDKPAIVLTNYQNSYATLWFSLIHELYHVLFDWEDIKSDSYHLTDDDNEELTVKEREGMADKFARDYLISPEKLDKVRPFINDEAYVKRFAFENNVHRSIIYTFIAFDTQNSKAWARAKRFSPPIESTLQGLNYGWVDNKPLEEFITEKKYLIYN